MIRIVERKIDACDATTQVALAGNQNDSMQLPNEALKELSQLSFDVAPISVNRWAANMEGFGSCLIFRA